MSLTLTLKDKAKQKNSSPFYIRLLKNFYGVYKMVTLFYKKCVQKLDLAKNPVIINSGGFFVCCPLLSPVGKKEIFFPLLYF